MDNIVNFEEREVIAREARQWLIRLDSDTPLNAEDAQALHLWKARSPAHQQELKRLSEFWGDANVLTELSIPLQSKAHFHGLGPGQALREWWAGGGGAWRAGALGILSVLVLVFSFKSSLFPPALDARNAIYATAIGEQRKEVLVDGSVLQINTDSQVQVDYQAGVRKIRLLRGEAHFEVAHNQAWPFEVYAAKGRVKALGTAFSVRVNGDSLLDVIVTDGRVELAASVYAERPAPALPGQSQADHPPALPSMQTEEPAPSLQAVGKLSKGQGVSYSTDREDLNQQSRWENRLLAQAEIERQLAWREGYLVFNGESLQTVVNELNRYMPTTIEIADPALRAMAVGGRFKVGELHALFDVLEHNFGVQVSYVGDRHIRLGVATDQQKK